MGSRGRYQCGTARDGARTVSSDSLPEQVYGEEPAEDLRVVSMAELYMGEIFFRRP